MTTALRLDALELSVTTTRGAAGRVIYFQDGLNLIRADNSSGKSTALQAIVYALGLEGMLNASRRIPLAHAMTDRIEIDGQDAKVTESYVALQFRNAAGEVATAKRWAVNARVKKDLVTVEAGPAITSSGDYAARDYFVRLAGAAQNDSGFHKYLADFIGLDLPRVTRTDGGEAPLYLETIFPYSYVEQKHGWSSIQARLPNYLGIRDVGKRSAEFVLGLDVFARIQQRQRVASNVSELEKAWQRTSKDLIDGAARYGAVFSQVLPRLAGFESNGLPRPLVSITSGAWTEISEAIADLEAQLVEWEKGTSPTAQATSEEGARELGAAEAGLRQAISISTAVREEESEVAGRVLQLDLRIEALSDDLQRHKDSRTLANLGSAVSTSLLAEHVCPTCHQDIEDGADITTHAMTIEENITFIDRQLETFRATKADLTRVQQAMLVRLESLERQAHDFRGQIRALKETLTSANSSPSVSAIRRRLTTEDRLASLRTGREELDRIGLVLAETASDWSQQKLLLKSLGRTGLSELDEQKITELQDLMRSQLTDYQFNSLRPSEVDVSQETYRPVHEGFDLGFDISASDMIRVIWAYLFGVMDVGVKAGSHIGLLIFDEPKQQETARESYEALLKHASTRLAPGAQVIFATSESAASLVDMLQTDKHLVANLEPGEKLLQTTQIF
ncbi:AAA domain-containing protein [Frondihabitans sp. PhB188]|uniref:AAA family ATPase n=1 Tax=Frondihabitans sp. PhB188 TaxID=2485200 RepID=UPI000F478A3C|nr:AAA family ATPase [Frondihabitans sp. PhB188]ROQ37068.1 AAA domain-containing protein [Frondihabitans sp. PhB188]